MPAKFAVYQLDGTKALEHQAETLRRLQAANQSLYDQRIQNNTGLQVEERTNVRAAKPIVEPIVEVIKKLPVGLAGPAGPPAPAAPVPAPAPAPTAPAPAGAAGPAVAVGTGDAYDELKAVRTISGIKDYMTDEGSLRTHGGTLLLGKSVAVSYTPGTGELHVPGADIACTQGLAILLVGGKGGVFEDASGSDLVGAITSSDLDEYKRALAACKSNPTLLKSNDKKKALALAERAVSAPAPKPKGAGIRTKVGTDGSWGDMKVDLKALDKGTLRLFGRGADGKRAVVHEQPASAGLRHLLLRSASKAGAARGVFTEDDLKQWQKLAKDAGVRAPESNNKVRLLGAGVRQAVFISGTPAQMQERLDVLVGLKEAGNGSAEGTTEAHALADRLLLGRHLSKREHKQYFDRLVK